MAMDFFDKSFREKSPCISGVSVLDFNSGKYLFWKRYYYSKIQKA